MSNRRPRYAQVAETVVDTNAKQAETIATLTETNAKQAETIANRLRIG